MSSDKPGDVLYVGQDLMFLSRVAGAVTQLGRTMETAAGMGTAVEALAGRGFRVVLIDLTTPQLDLPELVRAARREASAHIVAFGPHVHEQQLAAAREAGCDEVMPRSRFSATYPALLADHLTQPPTEDGSAE